MASAFQATSPPLIKVAAALGNAGYSISRSHACAGSIKTNAPSSVIFDIMREWIKSNPVKMDNIKQGSPARTLLSQNQRCGLCFLLEGKLLYAEIFIRLTVIPSTLRKIPLRRVPCWQTSRLFGTNKIQRQIGVHRRKPTVPNAPKQNLELFYRVRDEVWQTC